MKTATTSVANTTLLTILLFLLNPHPIAASTSGSALITVEDYPVFGPKSPNNPPFCGMPYDSLNLNLITAVQSLTQAECGTCLEVCGSAGCANVLAVDKGGVGLDLSTGISKKVIGNNNGRGNAKWKPVAKAKCKGIWDGRMFGEENEIKIKERRLDLGVLAGIVAKNLVPVLDPSPVTPPPPPPPSSILNTDELPSILTATLLSSSNSTNATVSTVTIVTTFFPPTPTPTPTPPPTTTSTRTAPLDAVTYAYTNKGSVTIPRDGKMGASLWCVVGLVVVGVVEAGWRGFGGLLAL
ncbi:hypothetical protein FGG08_003185 [Glutinoglossum americanum]|uniref:Uncharacterized protein n=1 Tax=Glutinoglossum americanum TaxID=1670608 RepID=A0A9P8I7U4_9PEZI|nr:hypothetical protein FGG08_003185 [Glutinoglossum americanum]